MKKVKKIMALVLAAVMVMAMGMTAFAADDGSIKVTNATAGQTYKAYLIFTASPSDPDDVTSKIIYTATRAQVGVTGFDTYFDKVIDQDGNYSITKKTSANNDELISWIKDNFDSLKQGDAISGTWTDKDTVTFSSLKYGYYYITSSLGTLVTIDTAGKNVEVYDKNETKPNGPDKKITAEDSAIDSGLDHTGSDSTNDASVGSTETFTVEFDATNWVKDDDQQAADPGTQGTKITEWNFKDAPTGLAINVDSVKVYVNETQDITNTLTNKAVSADGVLTFTIPWVDENGKHLYETKEGKKLIPVKVVYDAVVTADAATAVAPNKVTVKYNNDTQVGNEATTTTYTYKFKLEKQDENKQPLTGAEFELYYGDSKNDSAPALKFTVDENGNYRFDPNGTVTRIAPSGNNATVTIIGLDKADYMLREVVAPKGYNKAEDTHVSTVSRVDTADASITKVTVENLKGTELPSTGGMGTTLFYVVGAILVIGAGVVLVARRRMNTEK